MWYELVQRGHLGLADHQRDQLLHAKALVTPPDWFPRSTGPSLPKIPCKRGEFGTLLSGSPSPTPPGWEIPLQLGKCVLMARSSECRGKHLPRERWSLWEFAGNKLRKLPDGVGDRLQGPSLETLEGLETLKGSVPVKAVAALRKSPVLEADSVPGPFGTCLLGAKLLGQLLWISTSASV